MQCDDSRLGSALGCFAVVDEKTADYSLVLKSPKVLRGRDGREQGESQAKSAFVTVRLPANARAEKPRLASAASRDAGLSRAVC
jgi:hypothetical protein